MVTNLGMAGDDDRDPYLGKFHYDPIRCFAPPPIALACTKPTRLLNGFTKNSEYAYFHIDIFV